MALTKSKKSKLLKELKPLIEALDSDYLPRNNHLLSTLNDIAVRIGAKPMTLGCGPCAVRDAKRIVKALKEYKPDPPKYPIGEEG